MIADGLDTFAGESGRRVDVAAGVAAVAGCRHLQCAELCRGVGIRHCASGATKPALRASGIAPPHGGEARRGVVSPASDDDGGGLHARCASRAQKRACNDSRVSAQTESGTPFKAVYGPENLAEFDPDLALGEPGHYPYTRGIHQSMYTTRPWTMRQYAGFGTAAESNARYRELIAQGTAGLSVAFDLPTQMGYDSDAPIAAGEVGKVGVAIDSIEDMRELFAGIPLDRVSTSMTINAPAAVLLLLYQLVAEEQGIPPASLSGTIQNDVLKEYIARGTYIFPPTPSLRLVGDSFAYCRDHLPRWNTISISGYHMAEAGATPAQEIAFTLTNGIAYVEAALAAGLEVDNFAPRLSFFFVSRTTLLEEVAKFRAARRIWAQLMREHFGARDEKAMMLRFHSQTAGVQLTAQQPEVNLVRVAVQALAAVLGGTQSLHTNSFDEAIALPTPKAARLALRTQQVLAYETDVTKTVDPFAGSYAVESLTNDVEEESRRLMEAVAERGGAVAAIEQGFQRAEIERSAYQVARQIDAGERVVVGVNRFQLEEEEPYEPLQVDPAIELTQAAKLAELRASRDGVAVNSALDGIRAAARGTGNVLVPMKEALGLRATVGEVCDALRDVWGVYRPRG
jgi:methylmalonyl-CoA mutase N-terminal domain/subunit